MSLFQSDPVDQIERLAATSSGLQTVSNALQTIASAIVSLNASLSSLDMTKLEKLAEMSNEGSISSFIGGIMDTITGGQAESPEATSVATEVKSESIQPGFDLTPMVTAINEVKAAVNNLASRPAVAYIQGKDAFSKEVSTTSVQNTYKFA